MNKDYCKPYEGRDIQILDQHAANTIAEDHLTFPYQLLDHLAHVLMLKEQEIISPEDAALILRAVLKLRREGPDIDLQMPQELITNALDPVQNVTRRHIIGGPSPERVQETIGNGQMQVDQLKTWRLTEEARLLAVEDALVAAAEAVVQANQK